MNECFPFHPRLNRCNSNSSYHLLSDFFLLTPHFILFNIHKNPERQVLTFPFYIGNKDSESKTCLRAYDYQVAEQRPKSRFL